MFNSNIPPENPISAPKNPLTQAQTKNKSWVSTLNKKIFRGFIKTNKLAKITHMKKHTNAVINPTTEWEKHHPLPFEEEFNINYRKTYLGKLRGPDLSHFFMIENCPNKPNMLENKNDKIKQSKSNDTFHSTDRDSHWFITKNSTAGTDESYAINRSRMIIKTIFNNDIKEVSKYHEWKFFALDKKPPIWEDFTNKLKIDSNTQSEFLYKLSHNKPNTANTTAFNFYTNKGLRKGFISKQTEMSNSLNQNWSKKNMKLKLDIQGFPSKERKYMTTAERRENYLNKRAEEFAERLWPTDNLMNPFSDNLFAEQQNERKDSLDSTQKILNVWNTNTNNKATTCSNVNFDEANQKSSNRDWGTYVSTTSNNVSINFGNINKKRKFNQNEPKILKKKFKDPREHYEYIHSLAFGEKKMKKDLKKNVRNKFGTGSPHKNSNKIEILNFIDDDSNWWKNKKHTHLSIYKHSTKTTDTWIANQLLGIFTESDIKRVLNGRPMVDYVTKENTYQEMEGSPYSY